MGGSNGGQYRDMAARDSKLGEGYMNQLLGQATTMGNQGSLLTGMGTKQLQSYFDKVNKDATEGLSTKSIWNDAQMGVNANNAALRGMEQNIQRNSRNSGQKSNQLFQLGLQKAAGASNAFLNAQNQAQNKADQGLANAAQLGYNTTALGREFSGDMMNAFGDVGSSYMSKAQAEIQAAQQADSAAKQAKMGLIGNVVGAGASIATGGMTSNWGRRQ